MKRRAFQFLAIASIACVALLLHSARRPRYGGALRAEVGAAVVSIDPAFPADTTDQTTLREKLLALVCDRLVTLDEHGQPKPALATSWQAAPGNKLWSFRLRSNVIAQDGAPLTADDIVPILEAANPRWRIGAAANPDGSTTLNIEVPGANPSLPAELAMPRNFVFRRGRSGAVVGTGPFQVTAWQAGQAEFKAFDAAWQGRPFVDSIELKMGLPARDRLINLETGKVDFVDVPPEEARRAADRGARILASLPDELLALEFARGPRAAEDPAHRHALAVSVERVALVNFVLQKQGELAWAPLPQWCTGTAILLTGHPPDPAQIKQLAAQFQNAPALLLGYDGAIALEKAVAERIAVNAREAGIRVSAQAASGAGEAFDVRLVRRKMISPIPRIALIELLRAWAPLEDADVVPLPDPAAPEDIYARESAAIENDRVIPLVYLPETFGLSARVRDWKSPLPASGDGWPLAQVWLEGDGR